MNSQPILTHLQSKIERQVLSGRIKWIVLTILGIVSASLGLKGFVIPSGFLDGGVTGISLLVNRLTGWPLPALIFLINIPFVVLAYYQVSRNFALRTIIAIGGLSLSLIYIQYPVVTQDKLLVAIFGGFFLGLGIGLCIRGGCVIDGTEVLAISTGRKIGLTIGDVILLINILIFSIAAFKFTLEIAMYSVLTYFAASKAVDFVVHGIEEYTGVTIVSEKSDEIRMMITEKMGRGVTILVGKRGFGKTGDHEGRIDVIYTVITRLEIARMKTEVNLIDENAFMVIHSVNDTIGGMVKRRALP
ncbi:MAG TPA: YitT family protein [Bacteroidia bacterium]|nr:YitT family protein [Bacteroidia bacterium]